MWTYVGHRGTRFIYNSDLSGAVRLVTKDGALEVSGQDVLDFVAAWVQKERVSVLEGLETHDILGLPKVCMPSFLEELNTPPSEETAEAPGEQEHT